MATPTLSLIEFRHDDPNITFYICRTCQTHIALGKAFIFNYSVEGVHAGVFAKAVNVYTFNAPAPQRQLVPYTMTDLYCMKCRDHLGWKFVVIPLDDLVITKEMVQLFLPKLQYWNGNSILDAETWEPAPEDD